MIDRSKVGARGRQPLGIVMMTLAMTECGAPNHPDTEVSSARASGTENREIRLENRVSSDSESVVSTAAPTDSTHDSNTMNVSAQAGDPNVMDVSGGSDLPPRVPSTAQPYSQIIEHAVAPIRTAVAGCMAPLGPRAPRMYRVMVELNGQLSPRSPQSVALPAQVASCVERVVRATTVNPAPPIVVLYDLYYLRGP